MARNTSLAIGLVAILIASKGISLFEIWILISTLWFSVILSPLYFLLFNMKISIRGLATSAIVGLITFVMWNLNIKPITHIDGLFPGFFANIITVLFFYFLGGRQKVFSDKELAKVRNAEIIQKQEKNPIFRLEARNNVLLGFSLVALQIMPLIFSTGSLTHSKLFLSLVNGSIAILLIFGSSLEIFAEAKHLQYLRLAALFFCLPATSAYLLLTSPENGLHLLTLLLSFIVMLASVERKYERKICFVCILTAFLTIGFYRYLNCQLCWPETFAWPHSFYLFGFLVVLFLIRSNLNSLHKEKELLVYRERCTMARSLSHDMSSPLLALRLLIDQAPSGEFNPQKYQLLKKIVNEMGSYFDSFILSSLQNTTQLKAQNLNQCLLDCIEKQKILHPNIEIQLKSKATLMARVDAVLFRRIINNLLNVCTRALSPNTSSITISLDQDLQGNPQISLYSENQGFLTSTLTSLFATDQSLANDLELGVSFQEFQTIIESWNGKLTLLPSADTSAILISLPRN